MTQTHQGLEKAAVEKRDGLAKEQPLKVTKPGRKNKGHVKRPDAFDAMAEALQKISYDHVKAMHKICAGFRISENPARNRVTAAYCNLYGIPPAEYSAAETDLLVEYGNWRRWMLNRGFGKQLNCALNICALGCNFTEAGRRQSISDRTAKDWAVKGVDGFVRANAIREPQDKRPVKKADKGDFNATRIVEFVE